jgi:hypothetical protein
MNAPIPRAWFGLAFFFGLIATFAITRTVESWTQLVPVSEDVPRLTRQVLLTLELTLVGFAAQAIWWVVRHRPRTRA